ncbi:MAG TPA: iron-sulfur cluster assembly accessory protein [Candidatus Xenobia bacterium]|nr:iron-sulfur cluster assembly accessory protein [Candidatus Xenobia bacterium]
MSEPSVQLTERAANRVRTLMAQGKIPPTAGLRMAVQGGGCSGLTYAVRFDAQPAERDRIFEFEGVRVFVDPKSLIYLAGTVLDYKEDLMQQGFVFENPNATKGCGCGASFSA